MPHDPFSFDLALEELRSVEPEGDPALSARRMNAKVVDALRQPRGNSMRIKLIRLSTATLAAALIASVAILAPRESFASNIKKIAKAFQSTNSYHVKSYWTIDGKRRLNSETWVNGDKFRTRMYDENGKSVDIGDVIFPPKGAKIDRDDAVGMVGKGSSVLAVGGGTGDHSTSATFTFSQDTKSINGVSSGKPVVKTVINGVSDPAVQKKIEELVASLDKNDPNFPEKLRDGILKIKDIDPAKFAADHKGASVTSEKKVVVKMTDDGKSPSGPKINIITNDHSPSGTTVSHFASVHYSVGSLQRQLANTELWTSGGQSSSKGDLIEHYRSKNTGMEMDVDVHTSLPQRVVTTVTINGKAIPTEDIYDYPTVVKP